MSSGVLNTAKLPPLEKEEVKDELQEVEGQEMEEEQDFDRAEEENVSIRLLTEFNRKLKETVKRLKMKLPRTSSTLTCS